MCGIAGWYRRGGQAGGGRRRHAPVRHDRPPRPRRQRRVHTDGDFGFGMRRLSIIDLAGGHQPIFTPQTGRHGIVFNGEIYNHPELRRELEADGVAFQTHSDTETLLAGFLPLGRRGLAPARGHVRRRDLGPPHPHADAGARPARHQAALRDAAARRPRLRRPKSARCARCPTTTSPSTNARSTTSSATATSSARAPSGSEVPSLDPGHILTIGPEGEATRPPVLAAALRPAPRPQRSRLDRRHRASRSTPPSRATCSPTSRSARSCRAASIPARSPRR